MGRWVFYLRDQGYAITGIDASAEAVRAAHLYDPDAAIRLGDVCDTGFPGGSFDAILSLGVMEHFIEGPQAVLCESKRLLAESGLLFVTIPPANAVRKLLVHPLLACKRRVRELAGQEFVFSEYRFSVAEFADHLRRAGFEIIEIATDELLLPKNMGLYVDFPCLRHRERKWTLNRAGLGVARTLNLFSDRISRGGVLFVCRKAPELRPAEAASGREASSGAGQ